MQIPEELREKVKSVLEGTRYSDYIEKYLKEDNIEMIMQALESCSAPISEDEVLDYIRECEFNEFSHSSQKRIAASNVLEELREYVASKISQGPVK